MRYMRGILFSVLCCCADGSLLAQGMQKRTLVDPSVAMSVSRTGLLEYDPSNWMDLTSITLKSVQTGVSTLGDVFGFLTGTADVENLLVAGSGLGGGVLEHWRRGTNGLMQKQSAYATQGGEFTGVCYDVSNDRIYILDAAAASIKVAQWDGTADLPTTSWSVWANANAIGELGNSGSYAYVLGLFENHGGTGINKVALLEYERERLAEQIGWRVFISGNSGSLAIGRESPFDADRHFLVDRLSVNEGGTTVSVIATHPGIELELVDSQGVLLGSAKVPAENDTVVISSSVPFVIGSSYLVRKKGASNRFEFTFECVRRHGFSETLSDGTSIDGLYHPGFLELGDQVFQSTVLLSRPVPPASAVEYTGVVGLAWRDPVTGQDPVVPVGSNVVLNTSIFVPCSGIMNTDGNGFVLTDRYVIPSDPVFEGSVMLTQFFLLDGSDWKLSETMGS